MPKPGPTTVPPSGGGPAGGPAQGDVAREPLVQLYLASVADVTEAQLILAKAFELKELASRLEMERLALQSSATLDTKGLKKQQALSAEADAAILQKMSEEKVLTKEGKERVRESLEPYGRGMLKAAKLPMEYKRFIDSARSTGPSIDGAFSLVGKGKAVFWVSRRVPPFMRSLGQTYRQITTYAKKQQIDLPADATAALDSFDAAEVEMASVEASTPPPPDEDQEAAEPAATVAAAPEPAHRSPEVSPAAAPAEEQVPAATPIRVRDASPAGASDPQATTPATPAGGARKPSQPTRPDAAPPARPREATRAAAAPLPGPATPGTAPPAPVQHPAPALAAVTSVATPESRPAVAARAPWPVPAPWPALPRVDEGPASPERLQEALASATQRLTAAAGRLRRAPMTGAAQRALRADHLRRCSDALEEAGATVRTGASLRRFVDRLDALSDGALALADEGVALATGDAAPARRVVMGEAGWTADAATRLFDAVAEAVAETEARLAPGQQREAHLAIRAGRDIVGMLGSATDPAVVRAHVATLRGVVETLAALHQESVAPDVPGLEVRLSRNANQGWVECGAERDGLVVPRVRFLEPRAAIVTIQNLDVAPRAAFVEIELTDDAGEPTGLAIRDDVTARPLAPGEIREVLLQIEPAGPRLWERTRRYRAYVE